MKTKRWFISYRFIEKDFLTEVVIRKGYKSVITDVTPATWLLWVVQGSGIEHNILYAEEISLALASELAHGGAGIPTYYIGIEGGVS